MASCEGNEGSGRLKLSPCRRIQSESLFLLFPTPARSTIFPRNPTRLAVLAQSGLKEMNFLCCLLLLGVLQTSAEFSTSLAHQRAYFWGQTVETIWKNGRSRKEGDDCNVETDLTQAYFILADLVHTHPNSLLEWAWPRYEFYTNASDKVDFMIVGDREETHPDIAFCPYRSPNDKLVCDNKKCINCDRLPSAADYLLKSACALNGNGGEDVETKPKAESSEIPIPEVKNLTKKECDPGWLTNEEAERFYKGWSDFTRTEYQACGYFPKVEVAFAYAYRLLYFYDYKAREELIGTFREFWEGKLRVLKGDNRAPEGLCYPGIVSNLAGTEKRGPWVCGKDALCIFCSNVTKEMTEIYEACHPEEPVKKTRLQEECVDLRDKATPPPSTTTSLSSGAALVEGQVTFVTIAAFLLTCYASGLNFRNCL